MARSFLAFTATLGFCFGAFAAESQKPEPIVTYTLDNGLEIVLAPDRRVPKVVMNVRYSVGSMNEPAGRSGFAHLFEHLMFSGTEAWPNVFEAHSALGNTINAWTMEDGTVYYVEGLSANLPMILSLEADRMANLGGNVDQRELDLQRSVVKNEMRQNVLDQPGASGWEAFWSGLYPKPHPYSRTVIGSIADLDSATLNDVRGFFDAYYAPNNAVLVVSGDFAVDDAKSLIASTFGLVPRGVDVPRAAVAAARPAPLRLEMQDRVPNPIVVAGYAGPDVRSPDNGALTIAADLLGNSEIGVLRSRLVSEKGVATYVSASWTPGLLGGRFTIEAGATEGVSAQTLETELKASITGAVAKPVDAADVDRARRGLLLSDRLDRESLKDRTEALAFQADMYGKVTYGLGDDPELTTANAKSVESAMRRILDPAAQSILVVSPGPRGGYPPVLTESSGAPQPFVVKARETILVPKLEAREAVEAALPARETKTLSNGMQLVHYTMPTAPIASIAVTSKAGWNNAPQGKEGLIAIAAGMAGRGAGDRPYGAFAKAAKDIDATISSEAESLATSVTLSAPVQTFDAGVALLADAVLRPRFDENEFAISKAETLDWLARREADLAGLADRAASTTLFPQNPGVAGPDWTAAGVRSMTRDEVRAAFTKIFRPANSTFYSVGPMPIEAVSASLAKAFGGWTGADPGFVADPTPPTRFPAGRTVLLVAEPGASQSALYVARPAPGLDEPYRNESVAVSQLLGGDFSSRLNTVIREQKGYSYGVDSYLIDDVRKGSGLVVATTVQRDTTGAAIAEIVKGFGDMATVPVAASEVNRTVTMYRQALAGEAETSAKLFENLLAAVGGGSTLEENHAWREAKTKLSLEEVGRQAVALSSLDPVLIVVVGDPEIVLPQLQAIGLTDVKRIDRGETPQPTADDRAAGLEGETAPIGNNADIGADGARGTTRGIHACPEGTTDCPSTAPRG